MRTKKLRRPCSKCDEYFTPTGRFQKLCQECLDKALKGKQIRSCKYKKVPVDVKVKKSNGEIAIIKATKTVRV